MRCPVCKREYPAGTTTCREDGSPLLEPIARVLRRGPMPLTQAVKIVDRACELLSGIHAAGKVHGNISVDTLFFRHVGGQLTVATTELGEGRAPPTSDPRADIQALGAVFYHMLKGSPYDEHADRPQSLLEDSLQDIPVELDALIRAMLAKNPAERPKSPDEVRAKLENLDLDSTVMGVRLAAIRDAVMPTDPTNMELELPPSTKDLDAPTLHAMEPFRKAALEEAYGDTIVRDRKDLGEDSQYPDADPSAFADTHLSLDKKAILVAISEARPPVLSPPAKSTSQSPPPTARPATVPSKQRALPDAITDVAPPPAKKPTVLPTPILIAVFVLVAAVASAIVILLLGT